MNHCENCPLRDSPCANSVGPKNARIAIVGRNPGRQEARTGVPFTGPSGQLLDATLAQVGLERDDLYIANAVDCHWPDDDGPPPEAYDACNDRLMRELAEVKPDVILTLGNEGTHAILPKKLGSIMKLVGSIHPFDRAYNGSKHTSWVIPTFHPAYILRGSLDGFHDFNEAIVRAKALVDGERPFPEELPYDRVHYYNSFESVRDQLRWLATQGPKTLAIDTETDSVRDPARQLLLLQLSDGKDAWVFEASNMLHAGEAYLLFKRMLEDSTRTWIFHNASFDLQHLQHNWSVMPEHIEDTMALALCLSEKLQHCGLKKLVNTYLSVPHYEQALQPYLKKKSDGYSKIPREVLVPYAGFDAIYTYRLLPVLQREVAKEGNGRLYPYLVEVQRLFAEMAYFGTCVDLDYVQELIGEYEPLRDSLEKELQAYAWKKGFRASTKDWPFLNPNSNPQLKTLLNDYCGFKTDTTDKYFMEDNKGHPFIDLLQEYRRVDHLMGTYINGIADDVWPDGRVHPDFSHGTVTGRNTIQYPPLQTLPSPGFDEKFKVKSIRKLFIPAPGCLIIHADYSQLELRVAWHISEDENFGIALQRPDMHKYMASLAFKKPESDITEWERARVKLVTFGMLYGRQAPSIAAQLQCPVEEAQALLDMFKAQFPKYFKWWLKTQNDAVVSGMLETEFGRRRRWELITPEMEHRIKTQAANFPIQSTANDICMSSLIKINRGLKERGWGRALFSVHDSVELEVREDIVKEAMRYTVDIMSKPFEHSVAVFKVKANYGRDLNEAGL